MTNLLFDANIKMALWAQVRASSTPEAAQVRTSSRKFRARVRGAYDAQEQIRARFRLPTTVLMKHDERRKASC
jgi:3'-phosphoadenosine 5'-phosphosulfate sulfotransferase